MDYKRALGVHHLGDLRAAARRRLPQAIFDYVEGGSYDEISLRANWEDLELLRLRQRVLVEVGSRSLGTAIAGEPASLPLALGPIGFSGLIRRGGEVEAARAAKIFGIPYCLSTFSTCSLEEVAAQSSASLFFQLYLFNDRGVNVTLIDRAKQARCKALVLTVDAAMHGRRNRDLDNGLVVPLRVRTKLALQMLAKPRWMYGWFSGRRTLGNLAMFVPPGGNELAAVSAWTESNCKGFATADDVEWVRQNWPGKLIVKGILTAEDARLAVELGADAIVVSNHGGRQLDGAQTAVRAFPEIRSAIGESAELLFDGGIRSGLDVLKALGSRRQGLPARTRLSLWPCGLRRAWRLRRLAADCGGTRLRHGDDRRQRRQSFARAVAGLTAASPVSSAKAFSVSPETNGITNCVR